MTLTFAAIRAPRENQKSVSIGPIQIECSLSLLVSCLVDDSIAVMMRAKSDRKFLARQLNLELTGLHTVIM
jgi:hypothetical protein